MEDAPGHPQTDLDKLQRSPNAIASWQNAQQHLRSRRFGPALASYQNLTAHYPGVPALWFELGVAAAGGLDFALADHSWQRTIELGRQDATLVFSVALQYYRIGRWEQARACVMRAIETDPASIRYRLTLASWEERRRRLDEAWHLVETCLGQHPKDGQVLYFKAFLQQRKGLNEEAEKNLRELLAADPLLPLDLQSDCHHLLAVILDEREQYAEAIRSLDQSKKLRRQTSHAAGFEETYDKMMVRKRDLLASLTPDTLRRWREASSPPPYPLTLLAGAPRSGTTLLEQVLGAHPDILVFDEAMAFVDEILNPLHPPPLALGLNLEALDRLAPSDCARLVDRYCKSLLRDPAEPAAGKLLIDKNPSITGLLHIWLRVFPHSKVIIALRDPRDVAISCYFQNIPVNAASVNFLSLERTARFYADCMDVWLRLRDLGGFDWIEQRYEDIVDNLEEEGKKLMAFLGRPWHINQVKYYETAGRKLLTAPTYSDVTKPVYNRAVGRWRHYADALAPFQSTFDKYLNALGYAK